MTVTPQVIQQLLDELEASRQARLRAWAELQQLCAVLSKLGNVVIDAPRMPPGESAKPDSLIRATSVSTATTA